MKKILITALAFSSALAFGADLQPINESFIGIGTGNLNGQNTSPTPNTYFDGTETWTAVTSSFSDRGYQGSTTPLSRNGLGGTGGSVDVFRDNSYTSNTLGNRASLEPDTQPTDLDYNASGSLYFSFLVNFDDYTARANDGVQQGVLVDFGHDTSTTTREFGVHIGGATGGNSSNFRLSLQTQGKKDTTQGSWDLVDSGLDLASGTNLVQLRVIHTSATVSGDARYELWLNPPSLSDPADFVHEENLSLAINNNDFGFDSFGISQSLNGEQSVLVDELYLGETSVIPEPGTLMLVGIALLAGIATFRRQR